MEKFENSFKPPEQEIEKPKKLTREEIISRLKSGESLENLILADLDLAGLNFEGKSFRYSDVRGMILYYPEKNGETEAKTDIRNTNWIDATFADTEMTYFDKVDAEGAIFGYAENLTSRKKRHQENYKKTSRGPKPEDTGGFYGFNGTGGNFRKTKWINADFGGDSGYEAIFSDADLSESTIEGSDLSGIDFSETNIDNIQIINPASLKGMKINEKQIEFVVKAIQLSNQEKQAEFLKEKTDKGSKKALKNYFQIVVVEIKD